MLPIDFVALVCYNLVDKNYCARFLWGVALILYQILALPDLTGRFLIMEIRRILSGALAAVIAATAISVTSFAAKPKSISLEGYEVIDAARLDHVQFNTDKPHAMTFSIRGGTATVAFWRQENKPVMKGRKDAFVYYLEDDNTTSGLGMRLGSDVLDYEGELLQLPIGNYVILWNDTDYADMVYWLDWGKAGSGTYDFSKDKYVMVQKSITPQMALHRLVSPRSLMQAHQLSSTRTPRLS